VRRAALLVVVLGLAACGGGEETRLSQEAYIAKADAVCAKVAAQQKALGVPTTLDQIPPYVDKAIPILDAGLKEIRALRPPENMEAGVDEWLASTSETREVLGDLKKAAEAGDAAAARAAGSRGNTVADERHEKAQALGLTACANG